ncbi:MAG: hypothetical protein LQ338_002634 [Usnochroma carphineum]|nr:MAG: hypothetical protein LQ338_002634 [Usnochroma carphineum]
MSDHITSDEASKQAKSFPEDPGHAQSEDLSHTLSSRQRSAGELIPIQGDKRSGVSDSPSEPTGNPRALDSQYPSVLEPGPEQSDVQQTSSQTLAAGQDIRPQGQSGLGTMEAEAIVCGQAVGTIGPREPEDAIDLTTNTSETLYCKRTFQMVIHRDNDQKAQRVACLDTGATPDAISLDVVNELGLKKEPYVGGELRPLGRPLIPDWQVSFDWHVSGKKKTYPSTFVVIDEQLSGDFDVLLGWKTIKKLRFYRVNDGVFFLAIDGSPEENEGLKEGSPNVEMDH